MTVNVNPFKMNSTFVEPVFMSINAIGLEENMEKEKVKEDMELDLFENVEKPIHPKSGVDLLDFLLKQRDADANVTMCPRCSVVFDKNATKAYKEHNEVEVEKEKERIEQERKEVKRKLAEKEAKVVSLRKDIAGK